MTMTRVGTLRHVRDSGFFKLDHPRAIDRVIDYFGERMPLALLRRRGRGRRPTSRLISKAS
jgi:hypothetical protein